MTKKIDSADVAADKAKAMQEYRAATGAAIDRIAKLRAARLARQADATPSPTKRKAAK
jgi:hypothetical protein